MIYFLNSESLVERVAFFKIHQGQSLQENFMLIWLIFPKEINISNTNHQSRLMRLQLKISLRIVGHPRCTQALFWVRQPPNTPERRPRLALIATACVVCLKMHEGQVILWPQSPLCWPFITWTPILLRSSLFLSSWALHKYLVSKSYLMPKQYILCTADVTKWQHR